MHNNAIRTFIATNIPLEVKSSINMICSGLRDLKIPKVSWVKPHGIHLTIKFLGRIHPGKTKWVLEALVELSEEISAFDISLSSIDAFPSLTDPKILWIGLQKNVRQLEFLSGLVDNKLRSLGFESERKRFTPHITIARIREGLDQVKLRHLNQAIDSITIDPPITWEIKALELIKSNLALSEPRYEVLGTATLKGPQKIIYG